MKNKYLPLKWFTVNLCWLTLSPIAFILCRKWNLCSKKARRWMMFLSPLFLVAYVALLVLGFLVVFTCVDRAKMNRGFKAFIEDESQIKVDFPKYRVTAKTLDIASMFSMFDDYGEKLEAEFDEVPSDAFYRQLDSLCIVDMDSGLGWSKKQDGTYRYFTFFAIPKQGDGTSLEILITKGKSTFVIEQGEL